MHAVQIEMFSSLEENVIFLSPREAVIIRARSTIMLLTAFLCYLILFWFVSFNLFCFGKISLCHLNFTSSLELAVATNTREISI